MARSASERLFVFTASSTEAYQNYINTIENGFLLNSVENFLPANDLENLRNIVAGKPVRAWGAVPGPGNLKNWTTMRIGDPILIYRNKNFEYYAFVTYKTHNTELAKHLWSVNGHGETWEYMYFLDNLSEVSVSIETFNELVGYQRHYTPPRL